MLGVLLSFTLAAKIKHAIPNAWNESFPTLNPLLKYISKYFDARA